MIALRLLAEHCGVPSLFAFGIPLFRIREPLPGMILIPVALIMPGRCSYLQTTLLTAEMFNRFLIPHFPSRY